MRLCLILILLAALTGCAARTPAPGLTPLPLEPTSLPEPTATSGPSIEQSRAVLEAYFAAYNQHNVDGVLATLNESFAYGDCDFAAQRMLIFETREALAEWLAARFAAQDQMVVEELIIAPAEGSPPNDPRSTAALVARTLTSVEGEKRSLFKIVLNEAGDRIQFLNTYGNVDCDAGR